MNKGLALDSAGKPEQSLDAFDQALQINPLDPMGWNNKGVVLRELGRFQEALASFNKALQIDPTYKVAQGNREATLQDLNQDDPYELDKMLWQAHSYDG
jgi:tetratricopeptide (TPR) repeat protein